MTYPAQGAGDFTPGAAITPADVAIITRTGLNVPANSAVTIGPVAVAAPAYAIAVDALISGSATIGILKVLFNWTDAISGVLVAQEQWYITGTTVTPAATNGLHTGRGPTKANLLTVLVHNYDTAQAATVDLMVWQSSRIVTRDDWRGLAEGGGYVTFTVPNSEAQSGVLGWEDNASIAAGTSTVWLCPLYAGQASLSVAPSTLTGFVFAVIVPLVDRPSINWPQIFETQIPAAGNTGYLALPRCPVLISISNTGSSPFTVFWSLLVQEFAS